MQELLLSLSKRELVAILELVNRSLTVHSNQDFLALLEELRKLVPVERLIAGLSRLDGQGRIQQILNISHVNYPDEWLDLYLNQGYITIDPIIRDQLNDFKPRTWSESFAHADSAQEKSFIEQARAFDLHEGVALSVPDKSGTASLFSFQGRAVTQHQRHLAVLEYLSPHLHCAFARIGHYPPSIGIALSVREKEILQWIKAGKTNWEISMILRISERTVKFHTQNLMAKLGASTRSHAVVLALRQGLIDM